MSISIFAVRVSAVSNERNANTAATSKAATADNSFTYNMTKRINCISHQNESWGHRQHDAHQPSRLSKSLRYACTLDTVQRKPMFSQSTAPATLNVTFNCTLLELPKATGREIR